jgi:tartrate dehydrogenase/decarboxylase/D-malate dehydrogenase
MREYKIAAIPGDGIGKEVIAAGLDVLRVLAERDGGFRLMVEHLPWGSDYYRREGRFMPEDGLARLSPSMRSISARWATPTSPIT